jgi:acetyl-CoA acetyltransferase
VAAPETAPAVPFRVSPPRTDNRKWPSYLRCVQGAPENRDKTGPDVSRADFTWCMTALTWGWSIEETAERLMEESGKARENGERYALLTAQNAAAAVERRKRSRA